MCIVIDWKIDRVFFVVIIRMIELFFIYFVLLNFIFVGVVVGIVVVVVVVGMIFIWGD